MINEYQWAKDLYDGNRKPSDDNNYGDCMYLARYLIGEGHSVKETADMIFEWGETNHIFFDNRVIPVCTKAAEMPPLRNHVDIHLSEKEVADIKRYLSSKKSQLVAVAMLCYAKAFHKPSDSFCISTYQMELWLNIKRTNISGRHIKDMEKMDFICKTNIAPVDEWMGFKKSRQNEYKFNFPLINQGKYVLKDNDIITFFNSL